MVLRNTGIIIANSNNDVMYMSLIVYNMGLRDTDLNWILIVLDLSQICFKISIRQPAIPCP